MPCYRIVNFCNSWPVRFLSKRSSVIVSVKSGIERVEYSSLYKYLVTDFFSCVIFLHLERATISAIGDCGSFACLVVYYEFPLKICSISSILNLLAFAIVSIGTPSSCIPLIICIFPC